MSFHQEFVALNVNEHLIKQFDCLKKGMNEFLVKYAAKHAKQGISTTMVLAVDDNTMAKLPIAAYYSLSLATICREQLPTSGLPPYPTRWIQLHQYFRPFHRSMHHPQNLNTMILYSIRNNKRSIGYK
jgi:hypothetical protein